LFGDNAIHSPLPGLEILNPMADDGTVEDWDAATKLWEYTISSRLTKPQPRNPMTNGLNSDLKPDELQALKEMEDLESQENLLADNPLLMSEPSWNPTKNREKAIEIAIEEWNCPAFWLARSGVLAAFAAGKATALVVDVGASSTAITPVHDGIMLRKGVQRTPLAGNFVSDQLRLLFNAQDPRIPLNPHYTILSKTPVDASQPAQAIYRSFTTGSTPTSSFRRLQEERLLLEFKESVVQVYPGPGRLQGHAPNGGLNEDHIKTLPGKPFEFPDGYNQLFGIERYRPAEAMFDHKIALPSKDGTVAATQAQTIGQCIQTALSQVDVDIRPNLLANVVVVGGSTLLNGFTDRLQSELVQAYPGPKVRIQAAGNYYERKFASWIGGSILASLGSFHQVCSAWVSHSVL
jgi:actin-related protein 4